jgi:type IV secretion system protein TrbJ
MRKEERVMMFKRSVRFYLIVAGLLLVLPQPSYAIFGVGDEVFDPTMYASQLRQLQQETSSSSPQAR